MKKIISIILILVLLCGTTVWAVDSFFSLEADQSGEQITAVVRLSEDITEENATMLQGELYYDPEMLTPVSITGAEGYEDLTCVISRRESRVQFFRVSETGEPLTLPAGQLVHVVFDSAGKETELRLELDLQTADGTVVADLTEYASVSIAPYNPFTDVPEKSFYYEPVLWAVDQGITNGTSPTTFSPNSDLLRSQVVVMLWRAAGKPEPASMDNPFTDVPAGSSYLKAVLWAVEEGITNGLTPTTFGPLGVCTRAQVVTFLWRYLDQPEVQAENPFTDVPEGKWYTTPVLWAVETGITNGMSATTFGGSTNCTRAHMVTFLYRAMN